MKSMLPITILPVSKANAHLLKPMLYLAFYVPEGEPPFPLSILERPDILKYYKDWGKEGDYGFIAFQADKVVGASWCRLHRPPDEGYGFVNEETPELNIALIPSATGKGLGTQLLIVLEEKLITAEVSSLSLSVDQRNVVAFRLYKKLDYQITQLAGTAITMLKVFDQK